MTTTAAAKIPVPPEVEAERADMDRVIGGESVVSQFLATVRRQPTDVSLRTRLGAPEGGWVEVTWSDYADRAARVGAGLKALGVERGDRVAMLLRNRPEFHYTDLGSLLIRATPVSIYNSSAPAQIKYLLTHSAAKVIVCENDDFAARVLKVRDELPDLQHVVVIEPSTLDGVRQYDELYAAEPVDIEAAAEAIEPTDLVTIIYTSGTTGAPKGVMLTHRNVAFNAEAFVRNTGLDLRGMPSISYLPMAHIAERDVTHYLHVRFGTIATCCEDILQIGKYMAEVRPVWWFCAPRMWEKLHAGLEAMLAADPELAKRFHAAQEVGQRYFEATNGRREAPADLEAEWQAARSDAIAPVLATIGLDRVQVAITGSAPLPRPVFDFFTRCGVPLSDWYGQSESGGFTCWDPINVVPGTSGTRFPGTEMRIAEDGEICTRGPNVFAGYLNAPDLTAETIDDDGWLHSGDLGFLDEGGNLHIVGRKKEMIVPASGHNVSPVAIEAALKEHLLIGQACVVGDGRPHIVGLVVLDADGLRTWANANGRGDLSLTDAATDAEVLAEIEKHVAATNENFSRAEQVRAYRVLGEEWLPDTDVMTPTAKMKRTGITDRYADVIEELYA